MVRDVGVLSIGKLVAGQERLRDPPFNLIVVC
jgi:hypothetical protein